MFSKPVRLQGIRDARTHACEGDRTAGTVPPGRVCDSIGTEALERFSLLPFWREPKTQHEQSLFCEAELGLLVLELPFLSPNNAYSEVKTHQRLGCGDLELR